MSVLIFIDQSEGHIKKSSFEALSYGAKLAEQLGIQAEGIVLGQVGDDLPALGKYGVKKIHHASSDTFNTLDAQPYTKAIADVAGSSGART